MLPTLVIIGRPNVGKSTLFNYLTRSRDAIVENMPGVTRDRIYGHGYYDNDEQTDPSKQDVHAEQDDHSEQDSHCEQQKGRQFIVIDTGGIMGDAENIQTLTEQQAWMAINEADMLLFMVDAQAGLQAGDEIIAEQLRATNKPVILVVNKSDGLNEDIAAAEFYSLGFAKQAIISAEHRRGTRQLLSLALASFPVNETSSPTTETGTRVAVIGRPNVGKSTLINRLLGEERVLVCDMPGTTRDSIFIPFTYREKNYTLIDTAGIRRRAKVTERLEQLSVIKSLQAIYAAHVVIIVINAQDNIGDQDLKLLGQVLKSGRALIIAVNKWDNLSAYQREQVQKELDRRLTFIDYAEKQFISALHGSGVGVLMQLVNRCHTSATRTLQTSELTEILQQAIFKHQPPLVRGRRIKLRYAHPGGYNPLTIIIHGKQAQKLPISYRRYLQNVYRKALNIIGAPIRIVMKTDDNPFQG